MILECPACSARFSVAATQIPEGGRVVRCSRCKHEWHTARASTAAKVEPSAPSAPPPDDIVEFIPKPVEEVRAAPPPTPDAEPIEDDFLRRIEAAMAEQETTKPAKSAFTKERRQTIVKPSASAKPYQFAAAGLACVWLAAALVAYFPSWANAPVVSNIYHALGATPTDGLVFSDVSMERVQEDGKTKFILSGSISNHSSTVRLVPSVRVSLRNKKDEAVWGREYPVNAELKAGQVYPFRITNVETSFASSVNSVVIDMGNTLELLVR